MTFDDLAKAFDTVSRDGKVKQSTKVNNSGTTCLQGSKMIESFLNHFR